VEPETRYAKSGDIHVAYQTLGDGPFDLVYVPGFVSNVECGWEEPSRARFLRRLASFSRLILFDKRGTGLSDPVRDAPTLEARMDDLRAVLDAVGSQRATLFGVHEGGSMAALFAATHPERTFALILHGASVRGLWALDYPWSPTAVEYQHELDEIERRWGSPHYSDEVLMRIAPSMAGDDAFRSWFGKYLRLSASPGTAAALHRMNMDIDLRHVLPAIRVPTLLLSRRGEAPELRRYLADSIPGATEVELPEVDRAPYVGDIEAVVGPVEDFARRAWGERAWEEDMPDRVLVTVLFTDIVESTSRAAEIGDRGWRELMDAHNAIVRRQLARFRGTEIKTVGDGFIATFDGPARGIRCACAIRDGVEELGIEIRAGLHCGESELIDGDLSGIAVHTGARVAALAKGGEVLVSTTVKDLVAGSGILFTDRGTYALKGVPGEWRLFAVG
jgi:class 3 adenylate cyclase